MFITPTIPPPTNKQINISTTNKEIPTPGSTVPQPPNHGSDKTPLSFTGVFRLSLVTFFGEQRK
ncbi:hypothetical protein LX64_04507 [Chitinophaga skermanii]|uniref:Uncharacterized protein n=1 Tax=Chitinophaga skermanii TaxID=331697 RepID=A0A327QCD9_9BACT|nr:hypothetical protein LX64_04507 [Chitinophaga skermanii]